MSTHKIRLFAISAIAVLALSIGVFYQSMTDSPYNEAPPSLEEVSDLTGATTTGSSAAYYYDDRSPAYIGSPSASYKQEQVGVNFMYSNADSTMNGFLSRIDGLNSGQFRFLSFGRSGRSGKYLALPAEYYTANYGVSEYCCGSLSENSLIPKNRVVLVYNSSAYQYLANPAEEVMNAGQVDVSYDGWHLVWLGNRNTLKLPGGSQVLSAWAVPIDGAESYKVFSADQGESFSTGSLISGIYWLKVGMLSPESGLLKVPEDDPRVNQLNQIAQLIKMAREQGGDGDLELNINNITLGNVSANCINSLIGDGNVMGNVSGSCNDNEIALAANPDLLNPGQVGGVVAGALASRLIMTPSAPQSVPYVQGAGDLNLPFNINFNNTSDQPVTLESFRVQIDGSGTLTSEYGTYNSATGIFTFRQGVVVRPGESLDLPFTFEVVDKDEEFSASFHDLETSLNDENETILYPNLRVVLNDISDQFVLPGQGGVDTNGDGVPDVFDTDGDGVVDRIDIDNDGQPDREIVDENGDGIDDLSRLPVRPVVPGAEQAEIFIFNSYQKNTCPLSEGSFETVTYNFNALNLAIGSNYTYVFSSNGNADITVNSPNLSVDFNFNSLDVVNFSVQVLKDGVNLGNPYSFTVSFDTAVCEAALAQAAAGAEGGEQQGPVLIDDNNDGTPDGVDLNRDGELSDDERFAQNQLIAGSRTYNVCPANDGEADTDTLDYTFYYNPVNELVAPFNVTLTTVDGGNDFASYVVNQVSPDGFYTINVDLVKDSVNLLTLSIEDDSTNLTLTSSTDVCQARLDAGLDPIDPGVEVDPLLLAFDSTLNACPQVEGNDAVALEFVFIPADNIDYTFEYVIGDDAPVVINVVGQDGPNYSTNVDVPNGGEVSLTIQVKSGDEVVATSQDVTLRSSIDDCQGAIDAARAEAAGGADGGGVQVPVVEGVSLAVFADNLNVNLCAESDSLVITHNLFVIVPETRDYQFEFKQTPPALKINGSGDQIVRMETRLEQNRVNIVPVEFTIPSNANNVEVKWALESPERVVGNGIFRVNVNQLECGGGAAEVADLLANQHVHVEFEKVETALEVCPEDAANIPNATTSIVLRNNSIHQVNLNSISFAAVVSAGQNLNYTVDGLTPVSPNLYNFEEGTTLAPLSYLRLTVNFEGLSDLNSFSFSFVDLDYSVADNVFDVLKVNGVNSDDALVDKEVYNFSKTPTDECTSDFTVKFDSYNPDNNSVAKFFAYNDDFNQGCIETPIFDFATFNEPIADLDFDFDIFNLFTNVFSFATSPSGKCLVGLDLDTVNQPIIVTPGITQTYNILNQENDNSGILDDDAKCYASVDSDGNNVLYNGTLLTVSNPRDEEVNFDLLLKTNIGDGILRKFTFDDRFFVPFNVTPESFDDGVRIYRFNLSIPANTVSELAYDNILSSQLSAMSNSIEFSFEAEGYEFLNDTVVVDPVRFETFPYVGDFDANEDGRLDDGEDLNRNGVMEFNSRQWQCDDFAGFFNSSILAGILSTLSNFTGGALDSLVEGVSAPTLGDGLNMFAFFDSLNDNQASIKDVANDLIAYSRNSQIDPETPIQTLIPNYCMDNSDSEFCNGVHPERTIQEPSQLYSLSTFAGGKLDTPIDLSPLQGVLDLLGMGDDSDEFSFDLRRGDTSLALLDEAVSKEQNYVVVDVNYDKEFPFFQNEGHAPNSKLYPVDVSITNNTNAAINLDYIKLIGAEEYFENVFIFNNDNISFGDATDLLDLDEDNPTVLQRNKSLSFKLLLKYSIDEEFNELDIKFDNLTFTPNSNVNILYRYNYFDENSEFASFTSSTDSFGFDLNNFIESPALIAEGAYAPDRYQISVCSSVNFPYLYNTLPIVFKLSQDQINNFAKFRISTDYLGNSLSIQSDDALEVLNNFNASSPYLYSNLNLGDNNLFSPKVLLALNSLDVFSNETEDGSYEPINIIFEFLDMSNQVLSSHQVPLMINFVDCGLSSEFDAPVDVLLDSVQLSSNSIDDYEFIFEDPEILIPASVNYEDYCSMDRRNFKFYVPYHVKNYRDDLILDINVTDKDIYQGNNSLLKVSVVDKSAPDLALITENIVDASQGDFSGLLELPSSTGVLVFDYSGSAIFEKPFELSFSMDGYFGVRKILTLSRGIEVCNVLGNDEVGIFRSPEYVYKDSDTTDYMFGIDTFNLNIEEFISGINFNNLNFDNVYLIHNDGVITLNRLANNFYNIPQQFFDNQHNTIYIPDLTQQQLDSIRSIKAELFNTDTSFIFGTFIRLVNADDTSLESIKTVFIEYLNANSNIDFNQNTSGYSYDFYDYFSSDTIDFSYDADFEYSNDSFEISLYLENLASLDRHLLGNEVDFNVSLADNRKFKFDIPFVKSDSSSATHYRLTFIGDEFDPAMYVSNQNQTLDLPDNNKIPVALTVPMDVVVDFGSLDDNNIFVSEYKQLIPVSYIRTLYPVKYAKPIIDVSDSQAVRDLDVNIHFSDLDDNILSLNRSKVTPDDYLFIDYDPTSLIFSETGYDTNVIKLGDIPSSIKATISSNYEHDTSGFISSFFQNFFDTVFNTKDYGPFVSNYLNPFEVRRAQYALENSNLPFMKFELSNLNSNPFPTLQNINQIDMHFEVSDSKVVESYIKDQYVAGTPLGLAFISDGEDFVLSGLTYVRTKSDGQVVYRLDLSGNSVLHSLNPNGTISIFTFMLPVAMPADLPGGYTMQLRNVMVSDYLGASKNAGVFQDMDGSLATPTLNFNANNIADIVDPLVNTYFASTRNFINVGCEFDFDPPILDEADNLGSMYAYYKDKFAFKTNLLNRIYSTDGCQAR